jgi:ATP-dependent DNA helicase RecQ
LMLRSYGGIIDYYTTIREPFLATKMKMKESEVVKLLKKLAYAQVLQYEPANDKPTVTFLMPRVPEERLVLDEKRTESLRKMKTDRVQAMVGYIRNEDICRQVFIANYFGEKDAQPCGICDHCLDEKRRVAAAGWREMILHELRNKGAVNVQQLTALSPAVSGKEAILEQIRLLVDEKVLILNDDQTVRLP